MDITHLGHSSFRIRGKIATVVTEPFVSEPTGLKFPKHVEADVVTVSHLNDAVTALEGSPFIVHGAGEYEIKGVGVVGIGKTSGGNTIYRIEIDGVSIVHLGGLNQLLSASEVDELDGVDVLMVPVGGDKTIDASQAVQVINDIEPTIVIPMQYGNLDVFLKEIGKEGVLPVPKLTITKDKLPPEMQVVVLEL